MVKEIKSTTEFKELIDGEKFTVVDFYADWCGPCRQIAPFVTKLSEGEEYKEVNFVKINVDDLSDISAEFGVRAMPTFMLFKGGEKIAEVVGANPSALQTMVKTSVQKWLAGEPLTPLGKAPASPAADFINTYGRIIVILIGLAIWYFKQEATTPSAHSDDFPVDL
jgi:thioredoxin 1